MLCDTAFADLLAQELKAWPQEPPARAVLPTGSPLPPHPLLHARAYHHLGGAAAYGWKGRRRPPARSLTVGQEAALAALIGHGAVLGVDFTARELRSAYRTLARRYHPDRHPGTNNVEVDRLSRMFADVTVHYRRLLALCAPARA